MILAAGARNKRGSRFAVSLAGEEPVNGLPCYKIVCHDTSEQTGYEHYSLTIWLASRSWMPAHCEAFRPNLSKEIPQFVAHVAQFREISPGIWCPISANAVAYNNNAPARQRQTSRRLGISLQARKNEAKPALSHLDIQPDRRAEGRVGLRHQPGWKDRQEPCRRRKVNRFAIRSE